MGTVSNQEYKEILLLTLDEIDRFCRSNDIKYFLTGGTLLGAVRHQGFIPWDDDVDIGMPREDYNRFCASFNQGRVGSISLITHENCKEYYLPYGKVINKVVGLKEKINGSIVIGAYIDVFPYDNIIWPNNNTKK